MHKQYTEPFSNDNIMQYILYLTGITDLLIQMIKLYVYFHVTRHLQIVM